MLFQRLSSRFQCSATNKSCFIKRTLLDRRPLLAERETMFLPLLFLFGFSIFFVGILLVDSPSSNTKHDPKGDYEELPNFKVFHVIFQHHRKLQTALQLSDREGDADQNLGIKKIIEVLKYF